MTPCALLLSAGGQVFDAIRIAKAFAGESGSIATFPEIVRAVMDRPDETVFAGRMILSSSVLAFGRDITAGGYHGCIAHQSGFVEDLEGLRAAYERAIAGNTSSQYRIYGAPEHGWIETERFDRFLAQEQSFPVSLTCKQPSARRPYVSLDLIHSRFDDQMPAFLGSDCETFVTRRQAQYPCPADANELEQRAWQHGYFGNGIMHDEQVDVQDFRNGKYALASPLIFSQHVEDDKGQDELIAYSWPRHPAGVLVWRDRAQQSGDILVDAGSLEGWKLGRSDCFHSTEPALPEAPLPYVLGHSAAGRPEDTLSACRTRRGEDGRVSAIGDPLCLVEIVEKLGEYVREDAEVPEEFSKEEWDELMSRAPPGTQAIWVRVDLAKVRDECGPCGHDLVADSLAIEFLRIRPRHERRYLTVAELLADPYAYLRLIGAIE